MEMVFKGESMKPLSERTARLTIGMMRSMANCKPISPFHLNASYEMEQLLNEVMGYRKGVNNLDLMSKPSKRPLKEQK
jgi:hypothetical protein